MFDFLKRKAAELRSETSGNATLLVALGMPVLIGGAGLGTDLAQWYMWKRELQFAADQAAVAGAWAMTEPETEATFEQRARQEYTANLAATSSFAATPTVELSNFAGGSNNSVSVTATATQSLPFSSFLTGESATIWAYAQAQFEEGRSFESCLTALDEDDEGAITIGGSAVLTASCGMQALSTDPLSIRVSGNPTVDAGFIISRGGIEDWFRENTDDEILEYQNGLFDPFEGLTAPEPNESTVARTYSCSSQNQQTTADVYTRTQTNYYYYRGPSRNTAEPFTYSAAKPPSDISTSNYQQLVPDGTQAGTVVTNSDGTKQEIGGSGNNKIYERAATRDSRTYSNVNIAGGTNQGDVVPGTYTNIQIRCDTTFAPGVYIIDGGGLKITGQHEVTGSNVMFVLKNGAYIDIVGGSDNVNLTAIQASDLIARGIPPAEANELAGMLVFETRDSPGSTNTKFNGNAATVLNGAMYFPVSEVFFAGTASVTSQCLMIAASTITITGTTNMSTFCPPGSSENTTTAHISGKVRLVA